MHTGMDSIQYLHCTAWHECKSDREVTVPVLYSMQITMAVSAWLLNFETRRRVPVHG